MCVVELRPNIMHEAFSYGTARVGINYSTHSLVPAHSHTYTHSHSHSLTHCTLCTFTHSHTAHTHTHTHTAFASAARGSLTARQDSQRRFWRSEMHRRGLLINLISMLLSGWCNVHVLPILAAMYVRKVIIFLSPRYIFLLFALKFCCTLIKTYY